MLLRRWTLPNPEGYSLLHFKDVFTRWDSAFAKKGWLSIFLANHDQARMVSRFGNDSPAFREPSSKMLTTFIMTMRGTPYYYNGDELGMTNAGFTDINQYRDMPTLNEYQHQKDIGGNMDDYMKQISFASRDNGRTPMQWDSSRHAGFTTGTPWIKVNGNASFINVAAEEKDPNSPLNYFKKVVQLRKQNPVLVYGDYTLLDKDNPKVYAYTRVGNGKRMLIVLNFSSTAARTKTGLSGKANVLLSNYANGATTIDPATISLRPYEAVVYSLD